MSTNRGPRKHGATSKDSTVRREHRIWKNMRNRCLNPNNPSYPRYGGAGIGVCERWSAFEAFIADMGAAPSPLHTIDRIDNAVGYEPANCRWATQTEQQRNRTNNKLDQERANQIRELIASGASQRDIACRFGVSRRLVQLVSRGEAWS